MQSSVNPASTESIFMAQQSQLINKTLENLPNEAVMNILAGLNPVNLINWVANVLNHPKIKDYVGLIVLGLVAELTRRLSKHAFPYLESCICIKSTSATLDPSHDWLLSYWMTRKSWKENAKRFDGETGPNNGLTRSMPWLRIRHGDSKDKESTWQRRQAPKIRKCPADGESISFFWRSRIITMTRELRSSSDRYENRRIVLKMYGGSSKLYTGFMTEVKKKYHQDDEGMLAIRTLDSSQNSSWGQAVLRTKRPISSVVTPNGLAESIVTDMREFLDSEAWYTDRGIPFRRGYLLHGAAGAGKTSLIHACASALDLELYYITLATGGLTDESLLECMSEIPRGGVVVMEDIDVALPSQKSGVAPREDHGERSKGVPPNQGKRGRTESQITLSGILNSIDGVLGSEGRILFMTTNHKDKLDSALIRPGRADLTFEFRNATSSQIRQMFHRFYPAEAERSVVKAVRRNDSRSGEASIPAVSVEEMNVLAEKFVSAIPDGLVSTAAIQGHLMLHKSYPGDAVDAAEEWVAGIEEDLARQGATAAGEQLKPTVQINSHRVSAGTDDKKTNGFHVEKLDADRAEMRCEKISPSAEPTRSNSLEVEVV